MNRIILIGNGFDIAHGLNTRYSDFIDNFWKETYQDICSSGRKDYKSQILKYYPSSYLLQNVEREHFQCIENNVKQFGSRLIFENSFFKLLTEKKKIQNWVDIENEYYNLLINFIEDSKSLDQLNYEFGIIKDLLYKYLKQEQTKFNSKEISLIQEYIYSKIFEPYNDTDISYSTINKMLSQRKDLYNSSVPNSSFEKHFADGYIFHYEKLKKDILKPQNFDYIRDKSHPNAIQNILFLNFNYTNTEHLYNEDKLQTSTIHIHGEINNSDNPMIFGFGDELDDNYIRLEKTNDNRYLKNVKSIEYLNTTNYRKLLNFINGDFFQIYIMGHSCGNSDRTLLNTLFEHTNCSLIKIFYHEKIDGNSTTSNNYTDIVSNISRNFNSKSKMREIVLDKSLCEPLVPIAIQKAQRS